MVFELFGRKKDRVMREESAGENGRLNEVTEKIIGFSYKVANALGPGFAEKVYENALAHELAKASFSVKQQENILVRYDGIIVGDFYPDLIVDGRIIVEVKAVSELSKSHFSQCLNYLKAADLMVGLLINFGKPSVQVKRIAHRL